MVLGELTVSLTELQIAKEVTIQYMYMIIAVMDSLETDVLEALYSIL